MSEEERVCCRPARQAREHSIGTAHKQKGVLLQAAGSVCTAMLCIRCMAYVFVGNDAYSQIPHQCPQTIEALGLASFDVK